MHVDVRQAGSVVIVDLDGRLVSGVGDEVLREVMNELLAAGWKHILLNFRQVPRIDSAGIGELLASVHLAARFECRVALLGAAGQVRRVLELSQVLPEIPVYDEEETAIASFQCGPHQAT